MESLKEILLPPVNSTFASDVDGLFYFIHIASALLLLGITVAIIYFVIKYKRKSNEDVTPVIKHNTAIEVTWTVIPLILILIVFAWGFKGYVTMRNAPADAYEVYVTGFSFAWQFTYPNGVVTGSDLYVPAGRPIKLIMQSRDVLHSFFVPDFRIKQDLMPNRYTTVWFEAPEPGNHVIFCTEFCGSGHSSMMGTVRVLPEDEFNAWITREKELSEREMPLAELGRLQYTQQGCAACHSLDGTRGIGPSFLGLYGMNREFTDGTSQIADEGYLRESILEPATKIVTSYQGVMVSYAGIMTDQQINAVIEFIKELE